MSKLKSFFIVSVVLLCVGVSSCKKYLNVNTNPNVAQTATVQTLLPAGQLYLGTALGVDLEINGSIWGQYWDESPQASQYRTLAQYDPGQDVFSVPWTNLYAAAENFYQLGKLADSLKLKQYLAISLVMQAYTFQLLTDAYGDVPFTQALKGQFADGHIVNPVYDSQVVVYRGIITYIDSALTLFNPATNSLIPGTDDLLYGSLGATPQHINQWIAFSNTLKLRVLMRLSSIEPTIAADSIAALYSTSPTFLSTGGDAFISYGSSTSNQSPLYSEEVGLGYVQNLVASNPCIDTMISDNDPRLYVFYDADVNTGNYGGIPPGSTVVPPYLSTPSYFVGGDVNNSNYLQSSKAPVIFLSAAESYFLQAEAVARGYVAASSGLSDDSLFYYGIAANFSFYASDFTMYSNPIPANTPYQNYTSGASYWANYPAGGTMSNKIMFIITQKWLSMCGNQGFESWTEWRRTGYPNFLVISQDNLDGNQFPRRFLYPTSESNVNANYPGLKALYAPVWWDIL